MFDSTTINKQTEVLFANSPGLLAGLQWIFVLYISFLFPNPILHIFNFFLLYYFTFTKTTTKKLSEWNEEEVEEEEEGEKNYSIKSCQQTIKE